MQEAERQCAVGASDGELEQLREELGKWRARVPRLASALRQRTEELEALRLQASSPDDPGLRSAAGGVSDGEPAPGDAGIRQRDALIAELESKVQALDRSLRGAQGELHASRLELDDLRGEVGSWKQKWQEATQSLDDHSRLLAETRRERDQLHERNAQLQETAELASRQIEGLGESVEELRGQVRLGAEREREAGRRLEDAAAENARLSSRVEALAERADDLGGFAQTVCASAMASVHDVHAASQRLEDLRREKDAELQSLRQRAERAEQSLHRAERAAEENARHVTQLDDRLERQKTLLAELEEELAEARTGRISVDQQQEALKARTAEIAALKYKVRALEQTLREQTAELGRESWQKEFVEERPTDDPDSRMLLVLNQQLEAARAENVSLLERLQELEEELTHVGMQRDGDDLTLIHGVGPKLARQLNALGIFRLEQIAELDEGSLADDSHLLHAHKGRILRDGWIDQAARLISH